MAVWAVPIGEGAVLVVGRNGVAATCDGHVRPRRKLGRRDGPDLAGRRGDLQAAAFCGSCPEALERGVVARWTMQGVGSSWELVERALPLLPFLCLRGAPIHTRWEGCPWVALPLGSSAGSEGGGLMFCVEVMVWCIVEAWAAALGR
jgi:hypothetical protein